MENSIKLSCLTDDVLESAKEISFIEISRNDKAPIVYMRDCSNISYGGDTSSQFQAEGQISPNLSKSFLNVTLVHPKSEDTGIYTCIIYYVDGDGHMKEETTSSNLVVEKLDVQSLETVLNTLKDKMSSMDNQNKELLTDLQDQISNKDRKKVFLNFKRASIQYIFLNFHSVDSVLRDRVNALELKTTHQMNDLSSKVEYMEAFSATINSDTLPGTGKVIVFPKVLMQQGKGYDNKTGLFTAARAGIYIFHLVVRMHGSNYRMIIDIRARDQVIARCYAEDQSSVTAMVHLSQGDTVETMVNWNSGGAKIESYPDSIFSGYLIKSF